MSARRKDAAAGYFSGPEQDEQLVELEVVSIRDDETEDDAAIRQQLLSECERRNIGRVERGRA